MMTGSTILSKKSIKVTPGNQLLPFLTILCSYVLALLFDEEPAMVYSNFIVGSLIFGYFLNNVNNKPIICFLVLLSLVAYLTIFIGLRDFGIGTDTMVYIDEFWDEGKYIKSIGDFFYSDSLSKGFLLLSILGHIFSNDHQALLILTSLVINLFTFLAIYIINYKKLKINWVIYIFLWQMTCMNTSMNIMRQNCAQAIMLCSIALLYKKQYILGLITMFVASTFHSSFVIIILLFVFYILDKFFNSRTRNIYTILFLIALVIFSLNIFKYLSWFINQGLINIHFAIYTDNSLFKGENLFGMAYLLFSILFNYIILNLRRHNFISNSEAYLLMILYILSFILRLTSFFLVFLSRLSSYYVCIIYLVLACLLTRFSRKIPQSIQALIYICTLYNWFNYYIIHPGEETYPFHSEILGI